MSYYGDLYFKEDVNVMVAIAIVLIVLSLAFMFALCVMDKFENEIRQWIKQKLEERKHKPPKG